MSTKKILIKSQSLLPPESGRNNDDNDDSFDYRFQCRQKKNGEAEFPFFLS